MKKPFLPVFLIIVFASALLWRETRTGLLEAPEHAMSRWLASASGAGFDPAASLPTLVFQGGVSQEELSDFDIGMFVRACSRLGATVAAVATYEFPSSQLSLQTPRTATTKFVAGSLLVNQNASAGIPPESILLPEKEKWKPETFSGSFSAFSPGRGWQGGFLNLPIEKTSSDKLTVFSRLQSDDVASFAFACFLASFGTKSPPPISGSPDSGLLIGSLTLPVSREGTLPQDTSLIRKLRRIDMDDLLLQAERADSGRKPDKKLVQQIKGKIVLLGTLSQEDRNNIRLNDKRQISMVEYQGLMLASILAQAAPMKLPWWGDLLVLAVLCAYSLSLWFTRVSWTLPISLAALAFWVLISFSCVSQFGFALPILFPLAILVIAALLRYWLRSSAPSQEGQV